MQNSKNKKRNLKCEVNSSSLVIRGIQIKTIVKYDTAAELLKYKTVTTKNAGEAAERLNHSYTTVGYID